MPEPEYIRKDVFDIHVKNLRDRDDADERVTDIRFEQMSGLSICHFQYDAVWPAGHKQASFRKEICLI